MDYLWSPWRYNYVSKASPDEECFLCQCASEQDDRKNHVVLRAERNFIVLNSFPYTTGHMLIAPYVHVPNLIEAESETLKEMMLLARRAEAALRSVYSPGGLNIGLNLGQWAGAGVPGHLHMHVLPRWAGDVSFMTSVAETRVLPEDLAVTYEKLKDALAATPRE